MSRYVQETPLGFLQIPPPSEWPIVGPLVPAPVPPPKNMPKPMPSDVQPNKNTNNTAATVVSSATVVPWQNTAAPAASALASTVPNRMLLIGGGLAALGLGLFLITRKKKK